MELVNSGQNFSIANITMEFLMRNKNSNLNNCYNYSLHRHLESAEQPCNVPSSTNFFPDNISKAKNRGEVPFLIPGNIRKKFENFTRYINTKEHCLLKETMEHWSNMSSGYSEFVTSPRAYSDVSNSITSCLIGGFVGSKSQMNSDKHKLSYDLGSVILKVLHNLKYDKPYDKLREEKKFEINRLGKKSKSKDSNGFWQDIFCKNPNNKNNHFETEPNAGTSGCLNEDDISECNKTVEEEENDKKCTELIAEQVKCDIKTKLTSEIGAGKKINQVNADSMCLNNSFVDIISGNEEQIRNCANNEGHSERNHRHNDDLNQQNKEQLESDQKSDTSFLNSLHPVNCWSLGIRKRQFSECSVESTDSDSFIIFDDKCCDDHQSLALHVSENDESDYDFEEDDIYGNEDEDDCGWIENTDECDNGVEDREVAEANARWCEMYKDVKKDVDKSEIRVRFKDEVTVHKMVAWDYAYRAARPGPWEQMAHDRGRFKERIQRVSAVISPVLLQDHRRSVYNKLYA